MLVLDIYNFIDKIAPFNTQMDFDNAGILIGDLNKEVRKILISLDITSDVISEAKNLGVELIISHHPVIFNPIKKILKNDFSYLLVSLGISVICAHTNFDIAPKGINFHLCEKLGIKDLYPLLICNSLPFGYFGKIEPLTLIEFANLVKFNLNCSMLRFSFKKNKLIKRVAVCSGAGGNLIYEVIKNKCDAFVTGEIKHHEILLGNENDISILDVGHFKSENIMTSYLKKILQSKFSMLEFIESNCDDKIKFI
ncbi:MAG: Nif3-like dinuclear metal center hexameric protein [Firmicutes bacterium]|nr:Nif3-like dinuclear metal center hexameric protein [Bacillota bacterium]